MLILVNCEEFSMENVELVAMELGFDPTIVFERLSNPEFTRDAHRRSVFAAWLTGEACSGRESKLVEITSPRGHNSRPCWLVSSPIEPDNLNSPRLLFSF